MPVIPDGVLVFYTSFSSMYAFIDTWKGADRVRSSVGEHLLRNKQVVLGRDSSFFLSTNLAHRANVDGGRSRVPDSSSTMLFQTVHNKKMY